MSVDVGVVVGVDGDGDGDVNGQNLRTLDHRSGCVHGHVAVADNVKVNDDVNERAVLAEGGATAPAPRGSPG